MALGNTSPNIKRNLELLILHWVPPFIFAATGVFYFGKHVRNIGPTSKNGIKNSNEAACLWFDREPILPMPRNAQKKYQEWKRMILERRLSVTGPSLQDDIEISMKRESGINPHLVVHREDLKKVAESDNVEPRKGFHRVAGIGRPGRVQGRQKAPVGSSWVVLIE